MKSSREAGRQNGAKADGAPDARHVRNPPNRTRTGRTFVVQGGARASCGFAHVHNGDNVPTKALVAKDKKPREVSSAAVSRLNNAAA
jgi:hypothetical protein